MTLILLLVGIAGWFALSKRIQQLEWERLELIKRLQRLEVEVGTRDGTPGPHVKVPPGVGNEQPETRARRPKEAFEQSQEATGSTEARHTPGDMTVPPPMESSPPPIEPPTRVIQPEVTPTPPPTGGASTLDDRLVCVQCGTRGRPNARFCVACGTALHAPESGTSRQPAKPSLGIPPASTVAALSRPDVQPAVSASTPDPLTRHDDGVAVTPRVSIQSAAIPSVEEPTSEVPWTQRLRQRMAGEEWELVVGGSWLNKLGVFVLVIGIALFLGYSVTQLGPAGRVAIGLALSLGLLCGGIALERRAMYATFARGLVGGGWAALYFTVYAMYGLDAARVIHSPLLGITLLLTVATGMIAHSLLERSQAVTGLAFFVAFVTLAISPVSTFSLAASIPLAASLLFIARRFSWTEMAVAGVVATYGAYLVTTTTADAASSTDFLMRQANLWVYWVLFEAFDILEVRSRRPALALLNASGFIGVSLLEWQTVHGEPLHLFLMAASASFVASALIRAWMRPPSSYSDEADPVTRALAGGYEGAVTVAVILLTPAIFQRFLGLNVNIALLLEAELLFLAGLRLNQSYLRGLAGVVFAFPLAKLVVMDAGVAAVLVGSEPPEPDLVLRGFTLMAWTPVALLTAGVLYLNRGLLRRAHLRRPDRLYSFAASAVVFLVLCFEVPREYWGLSWLAFALVLFEVGTRASFSEFRSQSYALGLVAIFTGLVLNAFDSDSDPAVILVLTALLLYAATARVTRLSPGRLEHGEQGFVRVVIGCAGATFVAASLWHLLPLDYRGLGWLALTVPLFEIGLRTRLSEFRYQSYALGALGLVMLLLVNVLGLPGETTAPQWIALGPAALLMYGAFGRLFRLRVDRIPETERLVAVDAASIAGTALLAALLWHSLPAVVVAVSWGILSLLLLEVGFWLRLPSVRLQGHLLTGLTFGRLFLVNFTSLGVTAGVSHRVLTVVPLIVFFYLLRSRLEEERDKGSLEPFEGALSHVYLWAPAIAAVVLIRFELGRVLAVIGWSLLGLTLLITGHRLKNLHLRWQSYGIAVLSFVRSWTTNFYTPDSLAGVFGPALTGGIVVASFYAAQFISPRARQESGSEEGEGAAWLSQQVDVHARTIFSLLGTVLLTVLLFYEVSGVYLTVAWSVTGTVLLVLGFPLRERVLRLSGLVLLAVSVLRVFVYDFRNLETLSRIVSFIVLGLLLLAASWVYTRFREQLQRYL